MKVPLNQACATPESRLPSDHPVVCNDENSDWAYIPDLQVNSSQLGASYSVDDGMVFSNIYRFLPRIDKFLKRPKTRNSQQILQQLRVPLPSKLTDTASNTHFAPDTCTGFDMLLAL
jgi:hypothetical protein